MVRHSLLAATIVVSVALFAVTEGNLIYKMEARTGDKLYAGMDLAGFISISIFGEAGEHCHISSLDNGGNTFRRKWARQSAWLEC